MNHGAKEDVRYNGDDAITANTVEGYYSIFKRSMKGVYQHCKEKHLHRYLAAREIGADEETSAGDTDLERLASNSRSQEKNTSWP